MMNKILLNNITKLSKIFIHYKNRYKYCTSNRVCITYFFNNSQHKIKSQVFQNILYHINYQ